MATRYIELGESPSDIKGVTPPLAVDTSYLIQNVGGREIHLYESATSPTLPVESFIIKPGDTWTIKAGVDGLFCWVEELFSSNVGHLVINEV